MGRFHNTTGKVEFGLAMLVFVIGGSLQAQAHDTSYTASFSCAGYTGCPASGVMLKFTPNPGSHPERWQTWMSTATYPLGKTIAIVTNVDKVRFPPLDLGVGDSAAVWVGQIGPNAADRGFGIYKLDKYNHRVGSPWWKKAAAEITYCESPEHTPAPGRRSNAAIHIRDTAHEMQWSCGSMAGAANAQTSSNYHSAMLVSALRRSQGISHLWISCSGGCCDVGAM